MTEGFLGLAAIILLIFVIFGGLIVLGDIWSDSAEQAGRIGEEWVADGLHYALSPQDYFILHDLTLPVPGGTT